MTRPSTAEQLLSVTARVEAVAKRLRPLDHLDAERSELDQSVGALRSIAQHIGGPSEADLLGADPGLELLGTGEVVRAEDVEPEYDVLTCDVCGIRVGAGTTRVRGELLCDVCWEAEQDRTMRDATERDRALDADAHHERLRAEREDAA